MPDQRRTFSMGRGIRSSSRQTTGKTRVLGIPRGGGMGAVPSNDTGLNNVPTRPLRSEDESRLSQVGRDAVGYNSGDFHNPR
jgi:hypothetical protein